VSCGCHGCRGGGGRGGCRGVLGGAFGLKFGGVEDAVVAVGAYGEGLGVVLEGVGWGFRALVDDGEFAALFEQIEGGVGADAMDAAGGYVAGDAEMTDVGFVAHALEFADGDVVAFVVAAAAEGEIGDGAENDYGGDDEFDRAFPGLVWHMASASDFSLRLVQFTSVAAIQGMGGEVPPPPTFLCKVFERFHLRVDFNFSQDLNSLRSAAGDQQVCLF
jgi:hypothetical protein